MIISEKMIEIKMLHRSVLWFALTAFVTFSLVDEAMAFSSGSGTISCASGAPFHFPFSAQTTPSPYIISATRNAKGGLLVSIFALESNNTFRGFMLQAVSPEGQNIGTFFHLPEDAQSLDCSYPGGAVSHNSKSDKRIITVEWADASLLEKVTFVATVVKSYETFWTGISASYVINGPNEIIV